MAIRVKTGLVGAGHMGRLHLKKLVAEPSVEFVGLYDADPQNAARVGSEFGVKAHPSLPELFFSAEAVFICSSTPSHFAVAREAIQSGLHVFIEKPMCQTLGQAKELVELAENNGRLMQTGFVERYRVAKILKEISLGRVFHVEAIRHSTAPGRERGLDAVLDLMIHDIDLAAWLASGEPERLSAVGTSFGVSDLDAANAHLEFPSGVIADIQASWFAPERKRSLTLYGEKGWVTIDLISNVLDFVSSEIGKEREKRTLPLIDPLEDQCRGFIEAIRSASQPFVSGKDGLRAQRIAEQIQLTAQKWRSQMGMPLSRIVPAEEGPHAT